MAFLGTKENPVNKTGLLEVKRNNMEAVIHTIPATITLSSQASGDTIHLGTLPPNTRIHDVRMCASVSLGAATVKIGYAAYPMKASSTVGSEIRDAAVHTVTNMTSVVKASALVASESDAYRDIGLEVGTAALPASGTLSVYIDYIPSM